LSKPTAIDLFCGAGGLTAGLERAGFRIAGALDSWQRAVESYRKNFPHPIVAANISLLGPEDFLRSIQWTGDAIDLVAGGPPCQGFSVQRIGPYQDQRNDLILEFARFVLGLRPRVYLMENVPGLLGKRGRETAKRFELALRQGGYTVSFARVNAADYGVPQLRRRVFFYGWRVGERPFAFPGSAVAPPLHRTVWSAIGDLPSPPSDYTPSPRDPLHRRTRLAPQNVERLKLIPPGGGFTHLPESMRVDCHKNGPEKIGHRYVYGRLAPDEPSGTITARFDSFTRGKFAHPYEDRNITLREGARLQTFADDHAFCGSQEEIAALIGNAVPPLLAAMIGRGLYGHLTGERPVHDEAREQKELELFAAATQP